MALANGMMLGDKLNKEDNDYWRRQQREDVQAANLERDQAYKEQTQGYQLDDYKTKAQGMEGNRMVSQANDIYAKAAQAQGKSVADVLLESPEFTVPGASVDMQSHVSAGIRSGIVAETARRLRANNGPGDWAKAEALETKFGMANTSNTVNIASLYSDKQAGDDFLMKAFPGATVNPDGSIQVGEQRMPREVALFTGLRPNGIPQTAINNGLQNEKTARDAIVQQQAQAVFETAKKNGQYNVVRTLIEAGQPRSVMSPDQQQVYDAMVAQGYTQGGSAAAAANPNSVGSLTSPPTGFVTPGVSPTGAHSDWRTAPTIPTRPAMQQSGSPAGATPAPPEKDVQWKGMLEKANVLQSEVDSITAQKKEIQKDLQSMTSLAGRKHFDPVTIENARRKLVELNGVLSLKSTELNSVHSAIRAAPVARPGYVNILNDKYR